MTSEAAPLLRCERLSIGYGGRALLPPIDLTVHAGEFWAVIGRNGSGKSTWFRTVLGLQAPVGGRVERLAGRGRCAYVAQRLSFDDLWPMSAEEVVGLGLLTRWSFLRPWERGTERIHEALDAVGALDWRHRSFRSLSEGQKQRVLLARMVVSGASLALLDEPTAAMDAVAEREAMALLDNLRRRYGLAVLVVSHHLHATREVADRALFLDPDDGVVVVGTAAEVTHHPAFSARYGGEHAL